MTEWKDTGLDIPLTESFPTLSLWDFQNMNRGVQQTKIFIFRFLCLSFVFVVVVLIVVFLGALRLS